MAKNITIAIDGGAWVGKWTTALGVANNLDYAYVDTGAMYRAVTLYALDNDVDVHEQHMVESTLSEISLRFVPSEETGLSHMLLNGVDVEEQIRDERVSRKVAVVASYPEVREFLRQQQRLLAKNGWVVMDGRDMWSVVVPDAELKVHLTCWLEERAKRRVQQRAAKWEIVDLETMMKDLAARDEIDYTGETPTSQIAEDARELDTTNLTIDDQIQIVTQRAQKLIEEMT